MGSGSVGGNSSSGSSTPRTPGSGIGGGILADLFGLPTKLSNGKIILDARQGGTNNLGFSGGRETPFDTAQRRNSLLQDRQAIENTPFGSVGLALDAAGGGGRPRKLRTGGAFAQQGFGVDEFGNPIDASQNTGFGAIGQLLQQTNPFAGDFLDVIGQGSRAQQGIFQASTDQLIEMINSGGSPTNINALLNRGINDLKEQFSSTGGLFGSDVQSEALRFGGELGFQADESAKSRLLNAINLGQSLPQSSIEFGAGLLGLGQDFERVATPGGRALDLFNNLFGQQSSNLFSEGAVQRSNSSGFSLTGGNS